MALANQPVQQVFCPNCKGGNPMNAKTCMWCGKPMPKQPALAATRRRYHWWVWGIGAVLFVCVCGSVASLGNKQTSVEPVIDPHATQTADAKVVNPYLGAGDLTDTPSLPQQQAIATETPSFEQTALVAVTTAVSNASSDQSKNVLGKTFVIGDTPTAAVIAPAQIQGASSS